MRRPSHSPTPATLVVARALISRDGYVGSRYFGATLSGPREWIYSVSGEALDAEVRAVTRGQALAAVLATAHYRASQALAKARRLAGTEHQGEALDYLADAKAYARDARSIRAAIRRCRSWCSTCGDSPQCTHLPSTR